MSQVSQVVSQLDGVVSWLQQHMITVKLQHAEDNFPGDDSIAIRSKELHCCIPLPPSDLQRWHWSNNFVISILQCSCIFNFSLYDSTSPPYPPSLLISRLFSLMPLKAAPLRLVSLSIETLPNQMYPGTLVAPCDLVLQITPLPGNGTINWKCDPHPAYCNCSLISE